MKISKRFVAIVEGKGVECVEYKGKLFTVKKVGVGPLLTTKVKVYKGLYRTEEYYNWYEDRIKSPVFSKEIIEMLSANDRVNKAIESAEFLGEYTDEIIDSVLDCVYQLGNNPNGVIVYDKKVEQERKEKAMAEAEKAENLRLWEAKEIHIEKGSYLGIRLKNNLPQDVWSQIKPYAKYWSQYSIDTFFDFAGTFHDGSNKGWYYTPQAIEVLKSIGWNVCEEGFKGDIETIINLPNHTKQNNV